jgi:hypothetical protein
MNQNIENIIYFVINRLQSTRSSSSMVILLIVKQIFTIICTNFKIIGMSFNSIILNNEIANETKLFNIFLLIY